MHDLHLLHLAARHAGEAPPLGAREVVVRARELARLDERDRAGPHPERERRARLAPDRARPAPVRPAGV